MEGVSGSSAVIAQRDLQFHVKIVFLVRLWRFLYLVFRQYRVLYSGKSDLLLAFAQWHGVSLTEILGKGGVGAKTPPKGGTVGKAPPD